MADLVRGGDPELQRLLEDVLSAKARHRAELRGRASPMADSTRDQTLEALEAYVAALHRRHLPVPPQMLGDLKLLRSLCAQTRRPRA